MAYRILAVDDEVALQNMIREILVTDGYEVDVAGSCAEALKKFRTASPDAVLLDVMLPDGDGFSLLGELRRERDVPVLFLSARDEDEARMITSQSHSCRRSCGCACAPCCAGCTAGSRKPPGWAGPKSYGAGGRCAGTARRSR